MDLVIEQGLRAQRIADLQLGLTKRRSYAILYAASGGANGRRRGMAAGRHAAWWALAALAGLADPGDEPATPDELGRALDELRWYLWDDGSPATGWVLRLAVEEPAEGLAWAVVATDAHLA